MKTKESREKEFDFSLVLTGVTELSTEVENALFESGCDDATISVSYGRLWLEFFRSAPSLKQAILSAIRDVRSAGIGADVLKVDATDLVTQAEVARRIGRTRQLVHQLVSGKRGPGKFPPPVCQLQAETPLWQWSAVSQWLFENDMIRGEELSDTEVVNAINTALEVAHQRSRNPKLVDEVTRAVVNNR